MALLEQEIGEDSDRMENSNSIEEKKSKSTGSESENTETDEQRSEREFVKKWQGIIKKDRDKHERDFERMRDNMDFVAGLQWNGQTSIRDDDERYVVNMTLRAVNQGVALLYAKDPKVKSSIRQRLNYQRWDGQMATIAIAQQIVQTGQMLGMPIPPDVVQMLQDYQQGRLREQLVKKVGKTLECVLQYQIDTQSPKFKTQMKQLVRRVRVCGVGYIKVQFCRDYENELTQSETKSSNIERAKAAKGILDKIEEGKVEDHHAAMQQLQNLVEGLSGGNNLGYDQVAVKERLIFDFPQATSIIPDRRCRILKGFVGCRHITEEFHYPLKYVNDFFEIKIEPTQDLKLYGDDRKEVEGNPETGGGDAGDKEMDKTVRLWQVYDLDTKTTFIVCDGWKDFVQKPEVIEPDVKGFWNIFPVTFNDIEVEEGCKATIFPPSDVDLMFSAQTEWNSIRNRLKRHRRANGPRYLYPDAQIDEEDLDRLEASEDQEFVKLKGVPPGTDLTKVMTAFPAVPIQPQLYDSQPLREDTLLATGQQEANIGPAQPNVTATVGTIAEQSRMSVSASDVDGLDDSLSDAMQCGGEMVLQEFSQETVIRIAGIGAVFPDQNRDEFINELDMEIVAASSGRPNKAVDIANWERLMPLIMQAAQMPPPLRKVAEACIRKLAEVLDSNIDPSEFFPPEQLMLPGQPDPNQQQQPPSQGQHAKSRPVPHSSGPMRPNGPRPPNAGGVPRPNQPLQPTQSGMAVPLAGHNPS